MMAVDWYSVLWFLAFGFLFFYLMRMGGCGMHSHGSTGHHGAHGPHGESPHEKAKVKDPVCGQYVDANTAPSATRFEAEMYYFDSKECHDVFWKEPARYVRKPAA